MLKRLRHAAFLLVASAGVAGSMGVRESFADEDALYELVKAAQARNLDSPDYEEGRIAFTVEYRPPADGPLGPFRPVRMRGRVIWKGEDGLWVYQAQDPDKYCSGDYLREELDDAVLQYMMIKGKSQYAYNSESNKLYVKPYGGPSMSTSLLDVMPLSNWFRCCPPNHKGGRPWTEMIGPSAPAMRPGDRISIVQDGDLIHQTRALEVGGTVTTTFSLRWDGNVVRDHFTGIGRHDEGSLVTYEWGRGPSGACVLRRCESKEFEPGSDTTVRQSYTLTIDSVDLDRPVRAAELSPAALLSMLPHDVFVNDQVSGKKYYPNPGVNPSKPQFDRLAEAIAGEGFLDKD